ncbi:hypothetical protein ABF638_33140, partial (plasmid) [Nostoc sp. CALU 1950]
GLPTAAPSFPFKMIIIIVSGIVYFLEVPLAELPNKKTVEDLGQMWKPYRSIACWYLWALMSTNLME